jgi:predicted amidophosphoribosyltransferase
MAVKNVELSNVTEGYSGNTAAGWTCSNCGKWVNFGETHVCGSAVNSYVFPCCACFNQINILIQRIDELLKKLEAKKE